MSWHEQIDNAVAKQAAVCATPTTVQFDEGLRSVLLGVEASSTADMQARSVAREMVHFAINPMITGLAAAHDTGPITTLADLDFTPSDDYAYTNDVVGGRLHRVSEAYSPYLHGAEPHTLHDALHSARHLLWLVCPSASGRFFRRQRVDVDMPRVAGLFAVTSQVHRNKCGDQENQAALQGLIERIAALTVGPVDIAY